MTKIAILVMMLPALAFAQPRKLVRKATFRSVPMVSRQSADTYVVIGESKPVKTLGCTISATNMLAVIEQGDHPYLRFVDGNGEEEGRCEIDTGKRLRRTVAAPTHKAIPRSVAVTR